MRLGNNSSGEPLITPRPVLAKHKARIGEFTSPLGPIWGVTEAVASVRQIVSDIEGLGRLSPTAMGIVFREIPQIMPTRGPAVVPVRPSEGVSSCVLHTTRDSGS